MEDQREFGVERTIEKKIERMRWKREENHFLAKMEVTREPFGTFNIYFETTIGEAGVKMEICGGFGLRKDTEEYANLEEAKKGIVAFLDEIEEKRSKLPLDVYLSARMAYNRVIATALQRMEGK